MREYRESHADPEVGRSVLPSRVPVGKLSPKFLAVVSGAGAFLRETSCICLDQSGLLFPVGRIMRGHALSPLLGFFLLPSHLDRVFFPHLSFHNT